MSKRGEFKSRERRPGDWSPEEQLQALHETHELSDEALQAWCREKGLFAHNLTAWRTAFCEGAKSPAGASAQSRTLKDENAKLKRELARKEKALAEAAALLILQKKYQALWEDRTEARRGGKECGGKGRTRGWP